MSGTNEASDHYFSGDPSAPSHPRNFKFTHNEHELEIISDRGVFSYGALDLGTRVLLDTVPTPGVGLALDIGCGAGPIALALATHGSVTGVYAVDTNTRALVLTRSSASLNHLNNVTACLPDDVPVDLKFETIWSNPPIRIGKEALHDLLDLWLPRLSESGECWLVVQKNLGADSLQHWIHSRGFDVTRMASRKGYRVFRVVHARNG